MVLHCSRLRALYLVCALLLMLLSGCRGSSNEAAPAATSTATSAPAEPVEPTPEPTAMLEAEATADPAASEENVGEAGTIPEVPAEAAAAAAGLRSFTIDAARSEARFLVDEVLMGNDKTVVGVTSHVTGTVELDPSDPAATQIGTIQIDARDIKTDSSRRNRSIQREILQSALDANRFITFAPTSIDGLPTEAAVGEPFEFSIAGDLTVRDVTRSVTFEMTVTPLSETEIAGAGRTTIQYPDFGIRIPNVPIVANVDEEVRLEIDFVAVQSE